VSEHWSRNDDVIATDLDTELVLLHPATRAVFTLNETGREIWMRLRDPVTIEDIVAVVVATFAVDDATATRDVGRVLFELAAAGLVRVA
jgi:hypothetical protein